MRSRLCQGGADRARAGFAAFAVMLTLSCEARSEGNGLPDAGVGAAPAAAPGRGGISGELCGEGMAFAEGFCIDRFEASLVRRDGVRHPYNERPSSMDGVMAVSEPYVFPQGYMSQYEAEAACANAGKRLCTREEWLAACMGPRKEDYPFLPVGGRPCNNGKAPHVMSIYFGPNVPGHYWDNQQFNDPIVNSTPGYLAKSGSDFDCVSGYGVFDMEGNLHEWTADVSPSGMGVFAGSCYSDRPLGCGYYAATHARGYHDYSTGFRCCGRPHGGRGR